MVDLLSAIEAAYRIDLPEREWLSGLVEAIRPQFPESMGAAGFTYDIDTARKLHPHALEWNGESILDPQVLLASLAAHSPEVVESRYMTLASGFASDAAAKSARRAYFQQGGIVDWFGINGLDADRCGCAVILAFTRRPVVGPGVRQQWGRVASHFSAARRLRQRLAALPPDGGVAAILTPGGKVEHAVGEATEGRARAELRDAVLRIERARGSLRHPAPTQAIDDWRALTSARWSLVDQVEHDGRRYVVAQRNEIQAPLNLTLSLRERQVVSQAAVGKTNKVIAYELGIAASTVGVLMSRAMKKLGAATRAEAIASFLQPAKED